jgi:hypothetical protein
MIDEKHDAPARKPAVHFINEGVLIAAGSSPRRRHQRQGRNVKILDQILEDLRSRDPRFHGGIPSEMSNPTLYLAVGVACRRLKIEMPPKKSIREWRRKK